MDFLYFQVIQVLVLIVIVAGCYFAVRLDDLISAIISLAVMSLVLSLEFYLLRAPDVAIAEAGIGAGLTIAIFVLAIRESERWIG